MLRIEDILAIPGNTVVYNRLKLMLEGKSAIAFIGAGASFPLYPLWSELINLLANEPIMRGLASQVDLKYWLRAAGHKPLQVASQIRSRLRDPLYYSFLYETFKDRTGSNGTPYTAAHSALVRARFKACITTNYDSGLLEARRILRPEIRDTSFSIWNQPFQVQRWLSGDLFESCPDCSILFAHGHFADPASIVLDHNSYRQAYYGTPYRRLFENLWIEHHLVFVGFSFHDTVLAQIADDVLWQITRPADSGPRHIAIIGIDQSYTEEMRVEYLDAYNAEALFYPVVDSDHSGLQILLDSLAKTETAPQAFGSQTERGGIVPSLFVHETTDDEKFTGRVDSLARLDRWVADPEVRVITVNALGGLGKTALVGHWLKTGRHSCEAVFFWSFYRDRDTKNCLELLRRFRVQLGASARLAIVFDGLEIIQEVPGTVAYGQFLEVELAEFLHSHCRSRDRSVIVLTSRFPFPDLTSYLGGAARSLALPSLEAAEGAELLASLGLDGASADRENISRDLSGHPLALRLFARSVPAELARDPSRLWRKIFDEPHLKDTNSIEAKMVRLLEFYEKRLPEAQRLALGLLALFRIPVSEQKLLPLWEKLPVKPADENALAGAMDALYREGFLTADSGSEGETRYACHPILRDHFRARVLSNPGFARDAADLLSNRPDEIRGQSLESVQVVATALEILLDSGEMKVADDLYRTGLENGWIFLHLPAPHLGMEVAGYFIRDDRRQTLDGQVGASRLGFYLNEMAVYAQLAGESARATHLYADVIEIDRRTGNQNDLAVHLHNLGHHEITLGRLSNAANLAAEALGLDIALENLYNVRDSRALIAYIASLRGDVSSADKQFSKANRLENEIDSRGIDLYSTRGIQWAEHLLRTGDEGPARELTLSNLEISQRTHWNQTGAQCNWLLGWLDCIAGKWSEAYRHVDAAKSIFFASHMIFHLARTLVIESACYLGERQYDSAFSACERALNLTAPRNYLLIHVDALNLRARIAIDRPNPDAASARDDAEAAAQLSVGCDYAWGQREAFEILARAWRRLGNENEAVRCGKVSADWNHRLRNLKSMRSG